MSLRRVVVRPKRAPKVELNEEQKTARTKLRGLYKRIKSAALVRDAAETERKDSQREAVALAQESGLAEIPIRFSLDGKMYSGSICAPKASPTWDEEKVIDWLHRTGRWDACSTRSFDQEKFEAEIARGSIPVKTVEKFKVEGTPISPYARIVEV